MYVSVPAGKTVIRFVHLFEKVPFFILQTRVKQK